MKQIVNGVLYDTDFSTLIYDNAIDKIKYYKSNYGNYFMGFHNGELFPCSEDTIKYVLGKHDVLKYIELFGEPERG